MVRIKQVSNHVLVAEFREYSVFKKH